MASSIADRWSFFDKLIQYFRFKKVLNLIPAGCILADCGCGTGDFLRSAQRRFSKGYGIETLAKDKKCGENFIFLEGDLNYKIPLANGSVDVVTALAVIEHLNSPETFIQEVYRILKRGGRLVLTTPSPKARPLLEFLAHKVKIISRKDIKDHKNYFDKKKLELLFGKFTDIKVEYFLFGLNTIAVVRK